MFAETSGESQNFGFLVISLASVSSLQLTAILIHGLPGIEKRLDIAYGLRDLGWNCLYFHFRGCWGSDSFPPPRFTL
jgi:hypothetical protein